MIDLLDRLKGRLTPEYNEWGDVNLSLQTVERFKYRTSKFEAAGMKHHNVPTKEIIRFIKEKLASCYTYTAKIKTLMDMEKTEQAHIIINGTLGIISRYNPRIEGSQLKQKSHNAYKLSLIPWPACNSV
jgi:hypothetical protein